MQSSHLLQSKFSEMFPSSTLSNGPHLAIEPQKKLSQSKQIIVFETSRDEPSSAKDTSEIDMQYPDFDIPDDPPEPFGDIESEVSKSLSNQNEESSENASVFAPDENFAEKRRWPCKMYADYSTLMAII